MSKARGEELFGILQEEAAEVIQAVSKRARFGDTERNRLDLVQELGDVFAVLKLLDEEKHFVLDDAEVEAAIQRKLEKLERNMVHKKDSST
jgi:NTP pyrophosphatase (non-canonical NTP hydrolase)